MPFILVFFSACVLTVTVLAACVLAPPVEEPKAFPIRIDPEPKEGSQGPEGSVGAWLTLEENHIYEIRLEGTIGGKVWEIYREPGTGRVMYRCVPGQDAASTGRESHPCPHPPLLIRPPFDLEVITGEEGAPGLEVRIRER